MTWIWGPVTIISIILLLLLFPIFAVFRQIVTLILTTRYGSNFGGLLNAYDAIQEKDSKKCPVCVLLIIQYNHTNSRNFYDTAEHELNRIIFLKQRQAPKGLAILKIFLGYPYLLKDVVRSKDCVKKLKVLNCPTGEVEKTDLLKLLSECSSEPLPKNGKGLWDIFIGTQPIKWETEVQNDKKICYPIFLRFHHSLGDATSIINVIIRIFGDRENIIGNLNSQQNSKLVSSDIQKLPKRFNDSRDNVRTLNNGESAKVELMDIFNQALNNVNTYIELLYDFLHYTSEICAKAFQSTSETNALRGPRLTFHRIFTAKIEETPHYIQLIKKIKCRIAGSTFMDVLVTAISASLNEYFQKNSLESPEYLTVLVPGTPRALKLLNTTPHKLAGSNATHNCQNNLYAILLKLPISYDDIKMGLTKRLKFIKKIRSHYQSLLNIKLGYWYQTVCGSLPGPLATFLTDLIVKYTVVVSNLPGPPPITVFGGHVVKDIVIFGPQREPGGVNFTVLTYDGRLQLTLTIDKALVSNEDDVQSILDGVCKYLDLLDRETDDVEANYANLQKKKFYNATKNS